MANPRRNSVQLHNHHSAIPLSHHPSPPSSASLASISAFLKRASAFPFALLLFLFLTWLCLRIQRSPSSSVLYHNASALSRLHSQIGSDADANLARFTASSLISKDRRGWLINPVSAARDKGIHGGAQLCKSIHVGEIRPGGFRGNHRHHTFNETFLIWGAETKYRVENSHIESNGYAEVSIDADDVAVAVSPSGIAHALINVDPMRTTFFLGCQDSIVDYNSSTTDYKVWKDLLLTS